ncbi:DUF4468 domain-containing protein [Spirosoma utsteinense]|uniref:DUF4468 domain-containing protein n=1 Tax=Spirosoma utsteinense TaxID=2585773 RepID=A0ABR6W6X1_9BACT|nr:DUF4468 domain-containing protein [Spirosoma utsteinense]MBC3786147.1 hypothetical protein [Spirosoma utsteinense]MBC3792336.1 hypothetical protein [Spirosoma utsteinense]
MKAVLLFFALIAVPAVAQIKLPANETGQVQYQEIVRIGDGKGPARQVFNQLRLWTEEHYPKNEAELQFDEQHGIVFVRSLFPSDDQTVRYTLTVEARIGRYRATITDLVAEQKGGLAQPVRPVSSTVEEIERAANGTTKNKVLVQQIAANQAELYRQIDQLCRATLASLKQSMTAATPAKP